MQRPQSAGPGGRRSRVPFSKRANGGGASVLSITGSGDRTKRPQSAPGSRKERIESIPRRKGPSVVQMSGPLQQHWEQKIDLANKNLKRKKAAKAREALERKLHLIVTGADEAGVDNIAQEKEPSVTHLPPPAMGGRKPRPRSALPGSRSAATLTGSVTAKRQRPQSAIARLQKVGSAPQLQAPDHIFSSKRPNVPAHEVDDMREEYNAHIRKLKSKIFALERERDDAVESQQSAEQQLENERADKESLLYNVHLLRKRLQLLTAREIQNQRQLRTFTKLQPLFQTLQEKFDFGSAEEVVARFEAMERGSLTHYKDITEANEQRMRLEQENSAIAKERNDQVASLKTEIFVGATKLEERINSLQRELDLALGETRRNAEYKDKFISLSCMVRELYMDACENTGLVDMTTVKARGESFEKSARVKYSQDEEDAHPDFNNPEAIVVALKSLYYCTGPTRAGKMLRESVVYANRMYKNHISRDSGHAFYDKDDHYVVEEGKTSVEDLRFKPAEILQCVSDLIDKKAILEKNLRNQAKEALAAKKKAEEDMAFQVRMARRNNK